MSETRPSLQVQLFVSFDLSLGSRALTASRLSFWLNADDKAIAEDRLGRTKRKTPYKADLRAAKRVLFNPMTYHLALIYIGFLLTGYGSNCELRFTPRVSLLMAHARLQPVPQVAEEPGRLSGVDH